MAKTINISDNLGYFLLRNLFGHEGCHDFDTSSEKSTSFFTIKES